MIQKLLIFLFLLSLLLGQFGAITILPGVNAYLHDILLIILLVFFVISKRKVLHELKGELIKPIFLFAGVGLISLLLNTQQFSNTQVFFGSLYLIRFVMYALLYVFVVNVKESPRYWQTRLYYLSVGLAVLGLIQYWYYPSLRNLLYLGWDEHLYRLFSTLLDPNYVGILLVLGILLGFSLYSKINKSILFTQTILFIALLLTVSRSAFLGLLMGLVVYFLVTKNKLAIYLGIVGTIALVLMPLRGVDTNRLLRVNSSVARIENIEQSTQIFLRSPVIGIGFNNLRALSSQAKMLDVNGIVSRDAAGVNSSLLFVLITTGIIGFAFFLYLVFFFYKLLDGKPIILRSVGLASMSALFLHSIFNNSLFYPWVMIWMWILWGSIELQKKRN